MLPGNKTLPTHFKPLHYALELNCLEIQDGLFSGIVKIDFKPELPSKHVFLNIRDIDILQAVVTTKADKKISLESQSYDEVTDVLILTFVEELDEEFTLDIQYRGTIQTNMTGFYKSQYTDPATEETKAMFSTQFEATDARRAFPCLDEPLLKATFDVTITAPTNLIVLSNMPNKSVEQLSRDGTAMHRFYTTPKMSTYLLAWALGDFEYIEKRTEKCIYPVVGQDSTEMQKLPVRVYAAKGKAMQGEFALDVASKVIDYYSSLFKIPYPLPKLDLLCVEAYSHNAMENFSLITFRPTALLLDGEVETSNTLSLQKIAYVVSHEIAHQWFGNLVTMKWWDELWLNEGFATWIGYYAVNWMFPEWDVPSLVMWKSHEVALELDSLKESHPVRVDIKNAKDIDQVFDTISYLKGCSILEMISEYVGPEEFIKGVALYLKRNEFSNATMGDLLGSVSEVCSLDVNSRLQDWILNIGYPLLEVRTAGPGEFALSQKRFLSTSRADATLSSWWLPLMLNNAATDQMLELWDKSATFNFPQDKLLHFNTNGLGFYRVKYEDRVLLQKICLNLNLLSSRGKIGLISDIQTTASAEDLLEVLSYFAKVQNPYDYYVWAVVFEACSRLQLLFFRSNSLRIYKKVISFVASVVEPQINNALSFLCNPSVILQDLADNRRALKSQFYEEVLLAAGKGSHWRVVEQCQSLFESGTVKAATRQIILVTVLTQPDTPAATFDTVASELNTATLAHKECLLSALGKVRNSRLFTKSFELLFRIQTMDVQFLAEAWGSNPYIRDDLWKFIKENYDRIVDQIGANSTVLERFVRFTLTNMTGFALKHEVELFFSDKDITSFDRALKQALEKIEKNTLYTEASTAESLEIKKSS
ncbi:LANO_0B05820g1_1 [Lachancea nothofagi CBS 11611]|uniref:Aminopeptidase n=1 Tax=Lachancea nothofagi CBS 11611 TaxID=1266666 RepID=A0A1G4IZ21_9SACH|nr:LANO_0B05820g1_1 [Lachancea nothofagi CBS 11611]